MADWVSVRAVNGDGPRCGCDKPSALHVEAGEGRWRDPDRDIFLCPNCTLAAVENYILDHQRQFGPCAFPEDPAHTDDCRYCAEEAA